MNSGPLICRILQPSEDVVPCPLASTLFSWKLLSLSPCVYVSLVLFSRSFTFLCISEVLTFQSVIAFGSSYLIVERPGGYTDVCHPSLCPVSSCAALLAPLSPGARHTPTSQHMRCCSTDLHVPLVSPFFSLIVSTDAFYLEFACLLCHLCLLLVPLVHFLSGLRICNSRTAVWFFLRISVFVDIKDLLSHFTVFSSNYLNMVFCVPLNIFVAPSKLSASSDI